MTQVVIAYLVGLLSGPAWVLMIETVNLYNSRRWQKRAAKVRAARKAQPITQDEIDGFNESLKDG